MDITDFFSLDFFRFLSTPGKSPEPEFVNVLGAQESIPPAFVARAGIFKHYGAQESIPRNEFRQPM
jgi:hypothetical protein